MKKILAVALATAVLTVGCSAPKTEQPAPVKTVDNTINIQLGGEPKSLDPAFAVQPDVQSYVLHLFTGLTRLDDQLAPVASMAESWEKNESDTGVITYTFKISEKAKWSDGQAVKPDDFIYAWRRVLDPATASPLAFQLYPILNARAIHEESESMDNLGVSVTEDGLLAVTLEGECPDFLQRLTTPAYMPLRQDMVTANPTGWFYDEAKFVSNGPYTLEKWERDNQLTLKKNNSYINSGDVTVNKLNFILVNNPTAIWAAFNENRIQLAKDVPLLELEETVASAEANGVVNSDITLGTQALVFNTGKEPWKNTSLRKALASAIDRSNVAAAMRNGSVPAAGLVPPGFALDNVDFSKKSGMALPATADSETTKKLFADAGYTDPSKLPTITLLINDEPANVRVATAIAESWKAFGVNTEIKALGWNEFIDARNNGEFDVVRTSYFSDTYYPSVYFDEFTTDNALNYAAYSNEKYDQLIALSYGREYIKPESKEDVDSENEKKTDKNETTAQQNDKKSDTVNEDAGTEEAVKAAEDKTPFEYLIEAEHLLVSEDYVTVPLTWYTNRYVAAKNFSRYSSYPTGAMYFGKAIYDFNTPAVK